jgi:hypothetical protein
MGWEHIVFGQFQAKRPRALVLWISSKHRHLHAWPAKRRCRSPFDFTCRDWIGHLLCPLHSILPGLPMISVHGSATRSPYAGAADAVDGGDAGSRRHPVDMHVQAPHSAALRILCRSCRAHHARPKAEACRCPHRRCGCSAEALSQDQDRIAPLRSVFAPLTGWLQRHISLESCQSGFSPSWSCVGS